MLSIWKRLGICLAASMAVATANADSNPQPVEPTQSRVRPYAMEHSKQWTFRTPAGRTFEVTVALPAQPAPAGGYPVMYVLDPRTSFATLTETARNHEWMFGPTVVVGVGYASEAEGSNRGFDMTPPGTDPAKLPKILPGGWGAVGGAEEFASFLLGDVRKAVAAEVSIDPHRQALFGHSLGGLFTLYVMFTRPQSFDTYIAGSPSIWWSDKVLLRELPRFQAALQKGDVEPRLLITVGGLEDRTNPEERRLLEMMKVPLEPDLAQFADMVGNARRLTTTLRDQHKVAVELVEFAGETHNSVIPAYLARGARFTLSRWYP
ncbi:alpha/beta hydrolase [Steroidobacter flavus]|uniref:Alpha/beta hydrolase n=1 Tax=Steroidobacter flavus TaxID=1842136 RepID=A0ABV8T4I2_9GAMM